MTATDMCQQCGYSIPPRPDPRGRRAKYCSDACRAAASRERARQRHAEELAAAQAQATLDFRTPDDMLAEVVQELEAVARIVQDRGEVPASLRPVVDAAQALVAAVTQAETPPPTQNRKVRRAVRRSSAKKTN